MYISTTYIDICCGADNYIDLANDLSLSVRVMMAKDNEENKGEVTNITKMIIYCHVYKCACKVHGGCIWLQLDE